MNHNCRTVNIIAFIFLVTSELFSQSVDCSSYDLGQVTTHIIKKGDNLISKVRSGILGDDTTKTHSADITLQIDEIWEIVKCMTARDEYNKEQIESLYRFYYASESAVETAFNNNTFASAHQRYNEATAELISAFRPSLKTSSGPDVLFSLGYYTDRTAALAITGNLSPDSRYGCLLGVQGTAHLTAGADADWGGANLFGGIIIGDVALLPGIAYQSRQDGGDKFSWAANIKYWKAGFFVGGGYSPVYGLGVEIGVGI